MLVRCRPIRLIPRKTRLAVFVHDASARSRWGCPVALLQYAIDQSNADLVKEWQ